MLNNNNLLIVGDSKLPRLRKALDSLIDKALDCQEALQNTNGKGDFTEAVTGLNTRIETWF